MAAFYVLLHLDVIEHITKSIFPRGVDFSLGPFPFQKLEKALGQACACLAGWRESQKWTICICVSQPGRRPKMRLQSDIDALAAIEEDALMMLKWIGLPDDKQNMRRCKGKVMVSINDHPDIRRVFDGFHFETLDIRYCNTNQRQGKAEVSGELVIMNWEPSAFGGLF
ncbi:hypothetical protein AZH11_13635 [Pseudomonas simiae]|nr:hypothetical protein AZH11_13635 [Pseudomonas simiae]